VNQVELMTAGIEPRIPFWMVSSCSLLSGFL